MNKGMKKIIAEINRKETKNERMVKINRKRERINKLL
jgi:hypothetical protein